MYLHISTYNKINMKLITEEIKKVLPKLYEQESLGYNATVYVKFFTPDSNWTWYATEFDGKDIFQVDIFQGGDDRGAAGRDYQPVVIH